jgi:nucleotide-binding universal stress UspA family protein
MNYRSILVHLDDSSRCGLRTDLAVQLARTHGAHLCGLAPSGLVDVSARVNPSLTGHPNYLELAAQRLRADAEALAGAFRARVAASGLTAFEARVDEEEVVPSIVAHGQVSDLVVLGQIDRAAPDSGLDWGFSEQVFLQTGTPVLVLPYAGPVDVIGRNVVVAWSASREATRAVRDALPMLRQAQRVHLMCFDRPDAARSVSRLQLNDAIAWLARHGVDAHIHQEPTQASVGDALLSRACDLGADLIVMGGYGHSRLRELVLGGVTRQLLAQMTVPVLFSH